MTFWHSGDDIWPSLSAVNGLPPCGRGLVDVVEWGRDLFRLWQLHAVAAANVGFFSRTVRTNVSEGMLTVVPMSLHCRLPTALVVSRLAFDLPIPVKNSATARPIRDQKLRGVYLRTKNRHSRIQQLSLFPICFHFWFRNILLGISTYRELIAADSAGHTIVRRHPPHP